VAARVAKSGRRKRRMVATGKLDSTLLDGTAEARIPVLGVPSSLFPQPSSLHQKPAILTETLLRVENREDHKKIRE